MLLRCHCERSEAISNELNGLLRGSAPRNDTSFITFVLVRLIPAVDPGLKTNTIH